MRWVVTVALLLAAGCAAGAHASSMPFTSPHSARREEREASFLCARLGAIEGARDTCRAAVLAVRRDDARALAALVDPELGVHVYRGTATGSATEQPSADALAAVIAREGGLRRYLRVWPSDDDLPIYVDERADASHVAIVAGGSCRHATLVLEPTHGVWRLRGINAWGCS